MLWCSCLVLSGSYILLLQRLQICWNFWVAAGIWLLPLFRSVFYYTFQDKFTKNWRYQSPSPHLLAMDDILMFQGKGSPVKANNLLMNVNCRTGMQLDREKPQNMGSRNHKLWSNRKSHWTSFMTPHRKEFFTQTFKLQGVVWSCVLTTVHVTPPQTYLVHRLWLGAFPH